MFVVDEIVMNFINECIVCCQAGQDPVCSGSAQCRSCSVTQTMCVTTPLAMTAHTGSPPMSLFQ